METPKFIKREDNLPEFIWLEEEQAYLMKFNLFKYTEFDATYEYIVDAKIKDVFTRSRAYITRHQHDSNNFIVWMPSGLSTRLTHFCYAGGLPAKPIRGTKTIAQINLNNDLRKSNLQLVLINKVKTNIYFYIPPAISAYALGKGSTPHGN